MIPKSLARNGWRPAHVWGAIALAILGVAITHEAWEDIFTLARRDEEASHIFLVPLIFLWLVWVRRGRLRQCRPVGQWVGPVLVGLGWLMNAVGYNHDYQALSHGGSLLLVLGCALTVIGSQVVWQLLPAFAVLPFLVPVPGTLRLDIAVPLQVVTARLTRTVLETLGTDVDLSGSVLMVNHEKVNIAEGCNGLRMVFAVLLVSYAFAFGTPLRWYARVIILAASPISAIVCNLIRLLPTVWLYGYQTKQFADFFHAAAGWCMLVVAFLGLMGIVRVLRWALVPVTRYTLAYD